MKSILKNIQRWTKDEIPKVDLHMHTRWTDGADTVQAMHASAEKAGLHAILFSEHARHTSGDWFNRFADEVRALPSGSCRAYVGVETKVNDLDGNLDITETILDQCDLVMASVHRFPGEKGIVRGFDEVDKAKAAQTEFELAMAILQNPRVDILAHPFGMCYRRFCVEPGQDLIETLMREAARRQVAFEINCHYHRDPWKWIGLCREFGTPISLGSNAHAYTEVGRIIRVLQGEESAWTSSVSS